MLHLVISFLTAQMFEVQKLHTETGHLQTYLAGT